MAVARGGEIDHDGLRGAADELDFDDPINIQYTSGTTGFPKGATLTHHNILNNGYFVAALLDYTEADRVCIPVPLYHCFGMVMGDLGATNLGACMVYPAETSIPRATLEACAEEKCTASTGSRRCSSPSSTTRFAELRPELAAHRDHGRLAVPDRGDEARQRRHGHRRDGDLLRDDRDLAGHDPGAQRRHAREPLFAPSAR